MRRGSARGGGANRLRLSDVRWKSRREKDRRNMAVYASNKNGGFGRGATWPGLGVRRGDQREEPKMI